MSEHSALPVANRATGSAPVQRGIYAQAWYADSHCYHPSLPPRRLRMVEQFADYRATMLTWPCLGGGGISLPYLEEEADGQVPPHFRLYGYLNDREFIKACQDEGIKVFSVIFCMQGWEFGAELSADGSEILALNELRGAGERVQLGLREFTQNTYPKLWSSFDSYFPGGLRNFRGEPVTDLWQEACSRDIHGNPLHAHWVECADRDQQCHYMDLNNPVWLEYLKAVIRIQLDAGVDGIQFDEPSSPISALQYGGCFCDVCMAGFTEHLRALKADTLPEEVQQALADSDFHYGRWLLAQGKTGIDADDRDFLTDSYARYTQRTAAESFAVLTGYAREYAASLGRTVLLSSNLYDGLPVFDPHLAMLDVAVPEQRTTLYKQPGWMRYMAGFASGKPLVVNVNPYGGILPELATDIALGRSRDRLRVMLYEAAALGVNMAVPYGAWMGSIIEDAFYAPHQLAMEVQDFLAEHEGSFGGASLSETAVVYSVESNFLEVSFRDMTVDDRDASTHGRASGRHIPFFRSCDTLASARQPFDALMFHDGVLRADDAEASALAGYRTVLLPDCTALTDRQVEAVTGYLNGGGKVLVLDRLGSGDSGVELTSILEHSGTRRIELAELVAAIGDSAVHLGVPADLAVNLQRSQSGVPVLHIINYDYDTGSDRTVAHADVPVAVRLPEQPAAIRVLTPGQPALQLQPERADDRLTRFILPRLDAYTIVEFLASTE